MSVPMTKPISAKFHVRKQPPVNNVHLLRQVCVRKFQMERRVVAGETARAKSKAVLRSLWVIGDELCGVRARSDLQQGGIGGEGRGREEGDEAAGYRLLPRDQPL